MFPVGTLYSALGAHKYTPGTAQAPALLASYFISAFFVTQIFFSFYFNVLILNLNQFLNKMSVFASCEVLVDPLHYITQM